MKVRGVVLDWAGTAVDHGCMAPVGVFVEVFRRHGVEVDVARAREPMGTHKREHIRQLCAMPEVASAWTAIHGSAPTDGDVDRLYHEAEPLQIACLPNHATPIVGVLDAVEALRARDIRIGSTTGYNRQMLDVLEAAAAKHGYRPDAAVAASEVGTGRPAPFLAWEAARRIGAWPVQAIVKVGDTVVDVEAGLNAGMWSVGVALTGNLVGLDAAGWAALGDDERDRRAARAREVLRVAGAHHVIDGLAELPGIVDRIDRAVAAGGRP